MSTTNDGRFAWMDDGLCRQMEPELFFPVAKNDPCLEAKAACQMCPVRVQCLEYALDRPALTDGVFGGASPRERLAMRKRRDGFLRCPRKGCSAELVSHQAMAAHLFMAHDKKKRAA